MKIEVVINDYNELKIQLRENGQNYSVPGTATVKAAVINQDTEAVVGPVTCNQAHPQASWGTGLVVVEMDTTVSAQLTPGPSTIEIEVTDAGNPKTFFYRFAEVVKSYIPNA